MMEIQGEGLIVRKKVRDSGYPSIDDLFEGYDGSYRPGEMDTDDCIGREVF